MLDDVSSEVRQDWLNLSFCRPVALFLHIVSASETIPVNM